MTTFEPPLSPELAPDARSIPRYSRAAVAGFVCALLGCLAVPAVLGLILGVIGIFQTSGGLRRGRGLAIAAVPLSVITGLVSIVAVSSYFLVRAIETVRRDAVVLLSASADERSAAIDDFYERCDATLKRDVEKEQFRAWLSAMITKHGVLTGLDDDDIVSMGADADTPSGVYVKLRGQFVNGPAGIYVAWAHSFDQPRISNVEIGGISPRADAFD